MQDFSNIPTFFQSIPVLIIDECNGAGTGFCIEHQSCLFLVTASHVLFNQNTDDLLCNAFEYRTWLGRENEVTGRETRRVNLETIGLQNILNVPKHDIAAIRLGTVNTIGEVAFGDGVEFVDSDGSGSLMVNRKERSLNYDDLKIGNEAFTIGYPLSIGLRDLPQFDYERPLLRKGTIAGKNPNLRTVILDCPVYKGNSGGPVVEIHRCGSHCTKNHFSIFGVVSQFIPHEENMYDSDFNLTSTTLSNSGYSVITPLDTLFDLIDEGMNESDECV